MEILRRVNAFLNQALIWLAASLMAAMIVLTVTNIVMRMFWVPVKGAFELMGYFGAIVTAFALGYTQMERGHVGVDILVLRFPGRVQRILNGFNFLICTIFFAMVTWQIAKYGTTLLRTGEVTETLRIVYYPFVYGVALGCAALSLVFLTDFLESVFRKIEANK